ITELNLEQLNNVTIVSASKTQMEAGQAPATSYVVTETQIRLRGYRSLLDVLMDAPDFKIDDKAYSTSRNIITMRGISGQEKFIVMLDGVRISSPTNEALSIMENYPVNLARQIEIVYGPASALYGADAFSGIINIISKKAEYASTRIEASYSAGDRGLQNGNIFASKKIAKDVVLTVSGQYFYDKGVMMNKQFKSDSLWDMTSHQTGTFNTLYGPMTPQKAVHGEYSAPLIAYNIYAGLSTGDFEFSFFKNHAQNSSAIENNPSNAVYNKDVFIGRGVSVFNARHSKTVGKVSFVTTLTSNQYQEDPRTSYRNMYTGMEPAYKYGYGSMLQAEEQVEWRLSKSTDLVGGIVYQSFFSLPESADLENPVQDSRAIEGILLNTPAYYRPEGLDAKVYALKYFNAGGYLQVQQKLANRATITAGARFDKNSRFGSTFNPRAGLVWNPSPTTTVKVMAGAAYLAPSPESSYGYYGTFTTLDSGRTYQANFFHLPNPKLKPMISNNIELSFRRYIGKNFSATMLGYYTRVTNLLDYASDEGHTNLYDGKFLGWNVDYIEVFINRGRENILGSSLQLAYQSNFHNGSIKAYSHMNYLKGRQSLHQSDENGVESSVQVESDNISHFIIKTGMDLSISNVSFSPRLIWASDQHISGFVDPEKPGERQTIPGYCLLNIAVAYKVGKVALFANITNALNQKYRSVGPNMDLLNKNTELFYGNHQDPIRVNGGLRFIL
ncbi:MAG TPA: TonB-dependent receptor, partial [Flavitalea sp.]|nr:TonB-dependent receptor [Flavitalea sp.]